MNLKTMAHEVEVYGYWCWGGFFQPHELAF